jgi:hypothetical protein
MTDDSEAALSTAARDLCPVDVSDLRTEAGETKVRRVREINAVKIIEDAAGHTHTIDAGQDPAEIVEACRDAANGVHYDGAVDATWFVSPALRRAIRRVRPRTPNIDGGVYLDGDPVIAGRSFAFDAVDSDGFYVGNKAVRPTETDSAARPLVVIRKKHVAAVETVNEPL